MRKIAVTLDAFGLSAQALDQALCLAERMGAQLEGIFIEDIDLIEISQLPFVRELRPVSRSETAIDVARMEQELRALARRAERLLGEQAARHNVAWTFRIWRGSIDSDLLAASMEADVLALSRLGAALSRGRRLAPRLTAVTVLFTGTEASGRALETAQKLAADPGKQLIILLSAGDEPGAERLHQLALQQLQEGGTAAQFIRFADGSLSDLIEILADTLSSVLIVERDSSLLRAPSLRQSLAALGCPLLVVR